MSYRPLATQPVPIPASVRSRRRSPSPARSAYSRSSRDGSDSSQSQRWYSPHHRPRSSASRSSGGHSSDLIFPMDPERGSTSSSSGHGCPALLYDIPPESRAPSGSAPMPVCSRCGRQYYGQAPTQNHSRSHRSQTLLCPSCTLRDRQLAPQRLPDADFYESAGYHLQRSTPERRPVSHNSRPRHEVADTRSGRQRVQSTTTHVFGRAFPSYGAPTTASNASQTFPPPPHIDQYALPPATPVRAAPANNISRPRTADPFGVSSYNRIVHHRRQ
ncbi:hypothetical protein C8Q76DRAFT_127417 [Earliella scabrosa]|nr:hypothetical protein C8Q76DRAFT_127417 [Earliella scabrosa]